MNEGCGRFRLKVTSASPFVVISATLLYQVSRGFLRSLSLLLAINRSNVHFTSAAVNGLPSCHLTPERSLNISFVWSSLNDQLSASSGTIVSIEFCGLC